VTLSEGGSIFKTPSCDLDRRARRGRRAFSEDQGKTILTVMPEGATCETGGKEYERAK
jgi:hypothetical protein